MPAHYPVNLIVEGRPCLVVGGGRVAARKVAGLLECGAEVHVVAPALSPEVRDQPGITWDERPYRPSDLAGRRLVIAATDDPGVNRAVYLDAEAAGVWVNGADDPAHCTFTLPSALRRGSLLLTVSTGGRSPALAVWIRHRLQAEFGPEYQVLLDLLAAERDAIRAAGRSSETLDWQKALDSDMLRWIRTGDLSHAREHLHTCLSSSSG